MTHLRSTLLCALLTAATGCVDNDSTLFIVQVQAATADNECVISPDPGALFRSRGLLDVSLQQSYGAGLLVGNQLVRRGDANRLRTETGRVQLYQADVEVYDYTAALISSFSQPISGFVDVSTGTDPGFGVTNVMLIDPNAAVAATGGGTEVVAQVKILGETLGGLEVETGFWSFPIVVCNGCITIVEPETCEDDIIPSCSIGQDTNKVDARDVDPNHPCNVGTP
jgi:hypothetical protein